MKSRQLEGVEVRFEPGLVVDDTPFKLGQSGWVEINGVRPFRKGMETCGGFEFYNVTQLTGKARGLYAWRDNDSLTNLAIGTHQKLYAEVGGGLYDISPGNGTLALEDGTDFLLEDGDTLQLEDVTGNEDGYGGSGYGTGGYGTGGYGISSGVDLYPLTWTFGNYGEWLVANPRGRGIFYWKNDTGAPAESIPGSPGNCDSILVTDRHVIAYGCSEELTGTYNPRCIRWCDFEDITDWTTATSNNAGEYIIDNAGRIVRAVQVGSAIYVFTDNAVYVQQYVGQPGQTYFFDLVETGCGLAGPNAVAVISQTLFWMSTDGKFWLMPYGGAPVRLVSPTGRDVSDSLAASQQEKVYASTRKEFNEVRWYYPDEADGDGLECSRYVSYNIAERKWGAGELARTAEIDQGTTLFPVSVSANGYIYYEEKGYSANGAALSRSCKSGFFYVAEGGRVISLRRLWPDFDDRQGNIKLTLHSRMVPGGAETSFGPYTIRPTDTVVDLATADGMPTGAMFALEWSSEAAPSFWRLGKITLSGIIRGRGLR